MPDHWEWLEEQGRRAILEQDRTLNAAKVKDIAAGDASAITYTPAVVTDWDGDADPGNVDDALDQLAERVDDVEGAGGHDPVTLAADAEVLLGLTGQQLTLDTQNPNIVLAGPAAAPAADPTFRALVDADIPAAIARDTEVATAVSDHAAAGDPHTGYQQESEKAAASGYCDLDASVLIPLARIPTTLTGKSADTLDTYHASAFVFKSLLTTLGDMIYATAASTWARLAGNITTTKKFLTQTGDGAASAAPVWGTIAATDIPTGIADDKIVQIDAADVATGEYAKFTANGLLSKTPAEVLADLSGQEADTFQLVFDAAPSADHTASGIVETLTAGTALVFGNAVYIGSDGKMELCDADAVATSVCSHICLATIAENATGLFLRQGNIRDDTWNWTPGQFIYLDTATPGNVVNTAPTGTDDCIVIVGVAKTADIIDFRPQLVIVEHT